MATIPDIWRQHQIPVIYRPDEKGNLKVRLPYREGNRNLLKGDASRRFQPVWDPEKKFWEVPKTWFTELVERVTELYGCAYVLQPHHPEERCTSSCQHAKRLECECSCLGRNHGCGGTHGRTILITDAEVIPWRDGYIAFQTFKAENKKVYDKP